MSDRPGSVRLHHAHHHRTWQCTTCWTIAIAFAAGCVAAA